MRNIAVLSAAALTLALGVAGAQAFPRAPDPISADGFHNSVYQVNGDAAAVTAATAATANASVDSRVPVPQRAGH